MRQIRISFHRTRLVASGVLLLFLSAVAVAPETRRDPTTPAGSCAGGVQAAIQAAEDLYFSGDLDRGLDILSRAPLGPECPDSVRAARDAEEGKLLAFKGFTTNQGYDEALAKLRHAETLALKSGELAIESDALTYEGFVRFARVMNQGRGDYALAMKALQRGIKLRRELKDERRISESLFYIGIVHERQGDDASAVASYRESHRIASNGRFALEDSYALRHLGFQAQKLGDLQQALRLFRESLELRRQIGFRIYLPFSYLAVGDVYAQMGKLDAAQSEYESGCNLAKELRAERVLVLCDLSFGDLYRLRGDERAASERFESARQLAGTIGFSRGERAAQARLERTGD